MAISILQHKTVQYSGAAPTITFDSNLTSGSLIVLCVSDESGAGTISASGASNGAYTQDVLQNGGGAAGQGGCAIFSKQNTATTAEVVTVTLGGGSSAGFLDIYEISGAAASSALDAVASGTGALNQQTITLTTTTGSPFSVSISTHYPSGATVDTGYTQAFAETGIATAYHYGEYRLDTGTAGNKVLTMGLGASEDWTSVAAAYKLLATGGNVTITPSAGSLTFTGAAPSVTNGQSKVITPPAGSLGLTGYVVTQTLTMQAPTAGSLALTGYAPTVTVSNPNPIITPPAGALGLTGNRPSVFGPSTGASSKGKIHIPINIGF